MTALVNLLAAAGPGATFNTRGAVYTADASGLISGVKTGSVDLLDLLGEGCMPLPYNPLANPRNFLDGGDFTVNPWQRATTSLFSSGVLASAITGTTPTYGADRFFAVGSGSSPSVLITQLADTTIPGFNQSMQITRSASNTNVSPIYTGQVVETLDAIRAQGQTMTLSFWARAAANYSGGSLSVALVWSTGTNQSAANAIAGSWSAQAYVPLTPGSTNGTAGSATGPALQPITATPTRYTFTGAVPANATQLGVLVYWTPTGTAGTTDGVIFQGFQLEVGATASPFEHEDVQIILEECQRYAWAIPEPASGVLVGAGTTLGANSQNFYLAAPVQFYKAPTVTIAAGSFKVAVAAAYAAATTLAAGATHTVNAISLTSANTASAGVGALLGGGGGGGYILASADF